METSLTLLDNSKAQTDLSGSLQVNLPSGKKFMMSQTVNEDETGEYTSTTNAGLGKSVNTIVTSWKKSPSTLKLASDISLKNADPVSFSGEYGIEQNTYKAAASVAKGSSKYSIMMSSKSDTGSVQASADVSCPTRRVIGNFEGTLVDNKYTSRAELRWDADRNDTKRVALFANGQFDSLRNMEGSLSAQYPTRTISINMRQSITSKYTSHVDFSWEPKETYAIDTTLGTYDKDDTKEMIANIKLSTPYKGYQSVDLTANQQINDGAFTTKIDMKWDKKGSASGTFTLKRPLSISAINADLVAKAPSLGIRSMQASLSHRLNNGLKTNAEFKWNQKSIQIGLTLSNSSDEGQTDLRGLVDIKSSFGPVKTLSLTAEHTNNGRKVDTNALLQYNKKSYGLASSLRGALRGWNLNTNGDISITLPSNTLSMNWNHKNTLSEITSSSKVDFNGKAIAMNLNGLQDMSLPKGTLSVSGEINGLGIQINHNHDSNHVDSSVKLLKDSATVVQSEAKYLNENGIVTSELSMTNPLYSGGDMTITFLADATQKPATAQIEVTLSPVQKIALSGSLLFDSMYKPGFEATANLLLPNTSAIAVSVSQKEQKNNIAAVLSIQYDTDKEIRLETVRRNDNRKELNLKFVSPYTEEYAAAAMYSFKNNRVETSGSIEAMPFVDKWSINGLLDYSDSASGNIRVNTPYTDMSYSQISFGSNMYNDERKTTVDIEYIPGNKISMQTTSNIKAVSDFSVSAEVSTPFECMTYSKATLRFNGDKSQFSQFGEIEYPAGQKTSVQSKVSMSPGIMGELSMKSPYTSDLGMSFGYESLSNGLQAHLEGTYNMKVRGEIRHEGTMEAFTSTSTLSIDEENYTGTMTFQLQPTMLTLLSIVTPSQSMKFSNKFDGSAQRFSDELEVSLSSYGKYSGSVNVDVLSNIDISGAIQTPIKGFRNLKAEFKHEGDMSRFLTHAELQNGPSMYSGDINFSRTPALTLDATINTPYTPIKIVRLSMNVEGVPQNFKLDGEFQRNKELTQLDLSANTLKKWSIDLTLRSPYIDTVKVSLDHWGKLSKFQSKLQASVGSAKLRSNAKFQLKPSMSALVSVRSPIAWLKNHQLSIKHSGTPDSFKCNLKYIMNGKTYTGDLSFQHLNSLKGDMTLKGPTFKPIKASISHEGRPQNFKSAASVSMGKQAIDVNANVNTVNGIKGNLEVKTPFTGYNNIKAALSHTGDYSKFDSHAEVAFNKRQSQVDMSFDSTKDLSASASVSTPFAGWKDVSSSFRHTGNAESFSTTGQVSKNGKGIEGQISFNNGDIMTGSASVKSTLPAVDNYEVSFAHQGGVSKFSSNAEFISGNARHATNVDFSSENGYEGSLKFESPLMRNAEVQFKHLMSNTSLNSDAFIEYDGTRQYGIHADMTTEPAVNGLFKITTPHDGYESTELTVHHDADESGFRSKSAFEMFGEKYEIEAGFSPVPDMRLFMTLKSPLFEDIESTLSYEGRFTRFSSRYEMSYGKTSQIRIQSSLNIEGPIAGDLAVISPYMKNFKASFSHSGSLESFATDGQVTFAGQKSTASVSFKMTPGIEASISISSPFSKDVQVQISHSGPISRSQTSASINYGGNSLWNLESSLSARKDLNAGLKMASVLSGYELMEVKLSIEGDMDDMVSHMEVSLNDAVVSGDLTFANNKGSITIKAPFMDTLFGSFEISNYNIFLADANSKITYGGQTLFDITSSMNIPDKAELTLLLPVEGFERSDVSFKRTADIGGHFIIDFNGLHHEADAYMNTGRTITVFVSLASPLLTAMSTRVEYKRTVVAMSVDTVMTYGDDKIEADVEYRTRPDVSAKITLKTPFFKNIDASATFEGQPINFKSTAAVTYGKIVNEVSGSLNIEDNIQGQMTIKSPIMMPIDISYEQVGSSSDFNCKAAVTIDSDRHTLDASYKIDNSIEATFNAQSATFGSTNGFMRLEGEPTDFEADFEFGRNNLKTTVKGTFKLQEEVKATFSIVSPYSNVKGAFSHSGSWQNFQSEAEVTVDGVQNTGKLQFNMETSHSIDMDINIANMSPLKLSADQTGTLSNFRTTFKIEQDQSELMSTEITFTKMPLEGRFNLKTPFQGYETIKAMFSHTGEVLNFQNHAEFEIVDEKSEIDMTFNIGTKLEGTLSASSPYFPAVGMKFDFAGNSGKSQTQIEFTFGKDTYALEADVDARTNLELNLKAQTPFSGYKTVTATMTHSGSFPNTNTFAQVKTTRRNLVTYSMILSTLNGYSAKVSAQSVFTPTLQLNFDHSGDMTAFKTNGEVRLDGEPNTIAVTFQTVPTLTGSVAVQSSMMMPASASFMFTPETAGQSIHVEGSMFGKTVSGDLKYDLGTQKGLTASVMTPFVGFEKMELSSNIRSFYKSMSAGLDIEYPGQKMSFESESNWRNGLTGSMTIKTPRNMIGVAKADFTFKGDLPKMETSINVKALGQKYSLNGDLDVSKMSANLNVATPFDGFENTGASFTSEGSVDDLNVNGKVFFVGEEIVYTLQNTRNSGRLETKSRLETPYTEDVVFDMLLTGTLDNIYHTISLSMGKDNFVALETTSKVSSSAVAIESTLKTGMTGYIDEQKLTVNYEGQLPNYKASATAKVFGSYYSVESDLSMDDGINAHLKINTPIQNFRDIELAFEHEGNYKRFSTKAELQYATDKKIDGNIQFLKYGWRRLETNIEINTPFVSFETTKASYRHTSNYEGFECDASATVMNKDVTGTLRATSSPMSMSLALTTPFEGFEQVGSDMRLIQGTGRMSAQANVKYMQDKEISVSSDMTVDNSVSGTIKITTPFSGFETSEMTVSQTGSLDDFQAVLTVDSPLTTPIRAQANMRYKALTNMDGTMTFTSQIENFENLKFSINNEALRKKYNSKVEMTWAPGKAITLDGTLTDNSYASSADVTLRTPFQSIRQANVNTKMGVRGNVYTNQVAVKYNFNVIADFDASVDLSTRKSLTYTMRTPIATMIKMEGDMTDKYDGVFTFSPSSDGTNEYKFTGSFDPTQKKLALRYNDDISIDGTMNQVNVNAYGDSYGYDTSYDSTTKYVKVILPQRSLLASLSQMTGTTEGKFMWDADRDDTKQIGFRSQLTPSEDSVKADITLTMPSLGKVITLNYSLIKHCLLFIQNIIVQFMVLIDINTFRQIQQNCYISINK